ncbi:Rossmann-fold NAD(P)-binding domain-containing protein [Streptobacillus canis]|uniref:hypothetical protein n=1 Tax=Streptobacillus canis TaxID=2678686 RepID=UPI0012E1913F|nr:hypothetical protein [Streptobacillus canis]
MKKIAYVGNKTNFEIYQIIHNRIKEVKNLNSEIYHVENIIQKYQEYIDEFDAVFFEDNLNPNSKYDFFYKNDEILVKESLKKIAFTELLKYSNFKVDKSNVLILETNEYFKTIYEVLKENNAERIHIASIKQNNNIKLDKGDYFKNFLDIERLSNLDLIINLTDVGSIYCIEESPLKKDTSITAKYALDLVKIPFESTFLKQFKFKNSNLIMAIDLCIIEMLQLLLILFGRKDIYYIEIIKQLHVFVDRKINPRIKTDVEEINTSKEFLKLLKGNMK